MVFDTLRTRPMSRLYIWYYLKVTERTHDEVMEDKCDSS